MQKRHFFCLVGHMSWSHMSTSLTRASCACIWSLL